MQEWYFYVDQGKTQGPYSRQEITDIIKAGRIHSFDLLYRDRAEKWLPAHQMSEFRSLFIIEKDKILDKSNQWVILVKEQRSGQPVFVQKGPIPTEQVEALLKSGEIKYRDFIWREGMSQWQRISAFEIFNPPPVKWQAPHQLVHEVALAEDAEEVTPPSQFFEEVTVFRPAPQVEAPPPEAETPPPPAGKLAPEGESATPPALTKVTSAAAGSASKEALREFRAPQEPRRIPKTAPITVPDLPEVRWWQRISRTQLSGVLAVVCAVGFAVMYRVELQEKLSRMWPTPTRDEKAARSRPAPHPQVARPSRPAIAPPPEAKVVPPQVSSPQAEMAPPPPPPPPEPRRAPTTLAVSVRGSDLLVTYDGSSHFPVRVVIVGRAGEILDRVSVFRVLQLRSDKGRMKAVNLNQLDLPEGAYLISAEAEGLTDRTGYRRGSRGNIFRTKLDRHRKLISLPFQRERRRLVKAVLELESVFRDAGAWSRSQGQASVARLQELRSGLRRWATQQLPGVSDANASRFVFPEYWFRLGGVVKQVDRAVETGDPIDVSRLVDEVQRVRSEILEIRLFQ